jgi:hypothetical protein
MGRDSRVKTERIFSLVLFAVGRRLCQPASISCKKCYHNGNTNLIYNRGRRRLFECYLWWRNDDSNEKICNLFPARGNLCRRVLETRWDSFSAADASHN